METWIGRQVFMAEDGPRIVTQEIFETWEDVNTWISHRRTITAMVLGRYDRDEYRYEVRMV
jgi:hypothetical protein